MYLSRILKEGQGIVELSDQLGTLSDPLALKTLFAMRAAAQRTREIAGAIARSEDEAQDVLGCLAEAGLAEKWAKDWWRLSPRGAELWTYLSPLVER